MYGSFKSKLIKYTFGTLLFSINIKIHEARTINNVLLEANTFQIHSHVSELFIHL